jgi:hypothetical protein
MREAPEGVLMRDAGTNGRRTTCPDEGRTTKKRPNERRTTAKPEIIDAPYPERYKSAKLLQQQDGIARSRRAPLGCGNRR